MFLYYYKMDNNNNNFINYLEQYNKVELSKSDFKDILKETSKDYFNNCLHLKINGNVASNAFYNCSKLSSNLILTPKDIDKVSNDFISGDILNKNDLLIAKSKEIETLLKEYKYLQEKNVDNKIVIKKAKNKIIKCEINNIDDIIQLINDNEYEEDTEYNIDLESLHKIKDDLIKLNGMIGLKKDKRISTRSDVIFFTEASYNR